MQKLTFADKHGSEVRTNLLAWCCIFCFLLAFGYVFEYLNRSQKTKSIGPNSSFEVQKF